MSFFDGKRKSTEKRLFLFCFSPTPCLLVVAYKLDFEDFIQHNAHCFETTSTYIDFFVFSVHLQRANDDKKSRQ